ncbi:hypothetical protein [Thioalkalivibrio thiocyanodenitrificans]|uniref:hypothetical protein n=1 Tax=Thioalkalivibrio thiocyanodenitrificans TaxID=243063 RepID=UPI0003689A9C|nr:hypothetical protein [Thioalkalivibrio thiocyanodenitrificans]
MLDARLKGLYTCLTSMLLPIVKAQPPQQNDVRLIAFGASNTILGDVVVEIDNAQAFSHFADFARLFLADHQAIHYGLILTGRVEPGESTDAPGVVLRAACTENGRPNANEYLIICGTDDCNLIWTHPLETVSTSAPFSPGAGRFFVSQNPPFITPGWLVDPSKDLSPEARDALRRLYSAETKH